MVALSADVAATRRQEREERERECLHRLRLLHRLLLIKRNLDHSAV